MIHRHRRHHRSVAAPFYSYFIYLFPENNKNTIANRKS